MDMRLIPSQSPRQATSSLTFTLHNCDHRQTTADTTSQCLPSYTSSPSSTVSSLYPPPHPLLPPHTNHPSIGGNIGNAKIEGLQEDLGLTNDQYNWCLTCFFFTYAAFEVPSNLILKRLRPSVWLPAIMVAWGVVMTLMGVVQNYAGLMTARIFLGVTEAGLFPGVAYYLTNWYKREEIQLRQAMFFVCQTRAVFVHLRLFRGSLCCRDSDSALELLLMSTD